MSRLLRPVYHVAMHLCVGVLLIGCVTINHSKIQDQFNAAVRADSVSVEDVPLGAPPTDDAKAAYGQIITELSDEKIAKLDDRLKPNAYAMRAVAEWRTGALTKARDTAIKGRALPNVDRSPRDRAV